MAMIWEIPDGGLTENLSEPLVTLQAHQRRVGIVNWHPLAENIILTAGFDYMVYIWNIETPDAPITNIEMHTDTIYCVAWNLNGTLCRSALGRREAVVVCAQSGQLHQADKAPKPKSKVRTCARVHVAAPTASARHKGSNVLLLWRWVTMMSGRAFYTPSHPSLALLCPRVWDPLPIPRHRLAHRDHVEGQEAPLH